MISLLACSGDLGVPGTALAAREGWQRCPPVGRGGFTPPPAPIPLLFSLHARVWHFISQIARHAEHAAVFCLSPSSSLAGGWSYSTFPVCWQALWREFSKRPQDVVFPLGIAKHKAGASLTPHLPSGGKSKDQCDLLGFGGTCIFPWSLGIMLPFNNLFSLPVHSRLPKSNWEAAWNSSRHGADGPSQIQQQIHPAGLRLQPPPGPW